MRIAPPVALLVALLLALSGVAATATTPSAHAAVPMRLLAFRGHFGGGGFSFGRRRGVGVFGRSRHPFLRHVGRVLFFTWLAHLFFSSGAGSLLLWIVVIALVAHLFRRRRRRFAY
jgi:hypothetical protein